MSSAFLPSWQSSILFQLGFTWSIDHRGSNDGSALVRVSRQLNEFLLDFPPQMHNLLPSRSFDDEIIEQRVNLELKLPGK
jgi:hypothetical protein